MFLALLSVLFSSASLRQSSGQAFAVESPQTVTKDAVVLSVENHYQNLTDLTAEVTQKNFLKSLNKTQSFEGTLAIKKPGRLLGLYEQPDHRHRWGHGLVSTPRKASRPSGGPFRTLSTPTSPWRSCWARPRSGTTSTRSGPTRRAPGPRAAAEKRRHNEEAPPPDGRGRAHYRDDHLRQVGKHHGHHLYGHPGGSRAGRQPVSLQGPEGDGSDRTVDR